MNRGDEIRDFAVLVKNRRYRDVHPHDAAVLGNVAFLKAIVAAPAGQDFLEEDPFQCEVVGMRKVGKVHLPQRLGVIAEHGAEALVELVYPAVAVGRGDADIDVLENAAEPVFALLQGLQCLLALGDVGIGADIMGDPSAAVLDGRNGQPVRMHFAVAGAVPDLALPGPVPHDLLPHRGIEPVVMAIRLEKIHAPADGFILRVAGDLSKGPIDAQDHVFGIGHHHAFVGFERGGGDAQRVIGLLALGDIAHGAGEVAAVLGLPQRDRAFEGAFAAVLAHADQFRDAAVPAFGVAVHQSLKAIHGGLLEARRNDPRQRLPDDLGLVKTEHPRGRRVPTDYFAGGIGGDNRIVGCFRHGAETLLPLAQAFCQSGLRGKSKQALLLPPEATQHRADGDDRGHGQQGDPGDELPQRSHDFVVIELGNQVPVGARHRLKGGQHLHAAIVPAAKRSRSGGTSGNGGGQQRVGQRAPQLHRGVLHMAQFVEKYHRFALAPHQQGFATGAGRRPAQDQRENGRIRLGMERQRSHGLPLPGDSAVQGYYEVERRQAVMGVQIELALRDVSAGQRRGQQRLCLRRDFMVLTGGQPPFALRVVQ